MIKTNAIKLKLYLKSFFYILGEKNRKKLSKIFFLNIIVSIFEFLSVALIIPIIIILIENDLGTYLSGLPTVQNGLDNFTLFQQILIFLAIINLIFLMRYFIILYVNFFKIKFINNVFENISKKLFVANILSDYEKLISYTSPEIVKNIYHECNEFSKNILTAIISISGEILKIIAILVILLWIDYFAVLLGVLFFGTFALIFLLYHKSRLRIWGNSHIISFEKMVKFINEGFASLKEVKLIKNKKFFFDNFSLHLKKLTETKYKKEVLSQIARPLMELFFILLISILIITKLYLSDTPSNIVILLGVFALGFVKLLPSVMKIINDIQSIFYSLSTIENIKKKIEDFHFLENKPQLKNKNFDLIKTIELEKIDYQYPKTKKIIFDNFSHTFKKGKIYGISGVSGSGKSTLISIMMGLLKPTSGTIKINNEISNIYDNDNYSHQVSYVPQKIFISNDSLQNNIALGLDEDQIDYQRIEMLVKKVNLDDLSKKLDKNSEILSEHGKNISEGQKQRLGIARALYLDRQILFLDEFTSSLDIENEKKLISNVLDFKNDKIIIIIAHKEEILDICDEVIKIKNVT